MSGKQTSILIVDDEDSVCTALSRFFSQMNFLTLSVESAAAARELLETQSVDVVLSDIVMPGEDGMQLMKWILGKMDKPPPVILMTGESKYTLEESIEMGAVGLFQKPFRPAVLVDIVRILAPR